LCLATLAAGCGGSLKAGTKDAASGTDVADKGDIALRDGPAGAEHGRFDAAADTVADLSPLQGDLAVEDGPSDLPPADGSGVDGAGDAAPDSSGDGPGPDASRDALVDATDDTSAIDGGLAAFCTGVAARMVVNGVGLTPTVATSPIAMDCCDGGGFAITNDSLAFPIGVEWIAEAGPGMTFPAEIDLATPPNGWRIRVIAGCSVTSAGCLGVQDYYQTGFSGWLMVQRDAIRGFDMSLCVHVEEDPGQPAYLLHALDLYVPQALMN
jgi:hypothetical protein